MATEEHKYLANIIKKTHATLREDALNYGAQIAWQRHVASKDILQEYATSMQKLATTYWSENLESKNGANCRVEWIKTQCKEYFINGGREKYDNREEEIQQKLQNTKAINHSSETNYFSEDKAITEFKNCDLNSKKTLRIERIQLLDVGSCYNPFVNEDSFEVTAIDLNGILDKVFQCDFLNVNVGKEKIISNNNQEILQLPENTFGVIVFSLFLEYLPCPEQRYACCKRAYDLLEHRGILVIITPDSKHVNANVRFMKSWRYVLSKLGFMRIKYEKLQHIHCIIYRKCIFKSVALRWTGMQVFPENDKLFSNENAIYIPQDFRNISNEIKEETKVEYNEDELSSVFSEMPFDS